MRKKLLISTLAGLSSLTCTLALASCDLSGILDQLTPTEHYHTWTEWKQTKAPTCDEAGEESRNCLYSKCDIGTETREIEALGHNFIDGVCKNCGVEQSTLDPEEGGNGEDNGDNEGGENGESEEYVHSWSEWTIVSNETCTTSGLEIRICQTDSSHSEQRFIAPKHSTVDREGQAATCTEKGWNAYVTCSRCDYTTYEELPANGHSFSDGVCSTCGKVDPDYMASEELSYTLSGDKTYYIVSGIGTCTDTDIVIPSTYQNLPVTTIGGSAFYNCSALTSVVIGDSVTTIGGSAFYNCSALTSVVIGDSVTSIDDCAFYNCSALTSVEIGKSVTVIGGSAFYNCSALTSVVIGDSVTSIGSSAFRDCTSLTNVEIGDSVTLIDSSAFYGCKSLTNVEIGDSVTLIGGYAFYNCSSLTSVEIPDSVTLIGGYAFYNCSALTSVVIGDSVTSIGSFAFEGCTSLTSVYYKGTAEEWAKISVSSYNTYLTNATRYYYSESQPTTSGNYWHYDENGEIVVW